MVLGRQKDYTLGKVTKRHNRWKYISMHLWKQRINSFPSDSSGAVWRALRAYMHQKENGEQCYIVAEKYRKLPSMTLFES